MVLLLRKPSISRPDYSHLLWPRVLHVLAGLIQLPLRFWAFSLGQVDPESSVLLFEGQQCFLLSPCCLRCHWRMPGANKHLFLQRGWAGALNILLFLLHPLQPCSSHLVSCCANGACNYIAAGKTLLLDYGGFCILFCAFFAQLHRQCY